MKKLLITAALVASVAGIGAPMAQAEPDPSGRPGYQPFPGEAYFRSNPPPNSRIISRMGQRLITIRECKKYYTKGPGPQWTKADQNAYACWQRKLGYSGSLADGFPGKKSWDALHVPYGYN